MKLNWRGGITLTTNLPPFDQLPPAIQAVIKAKGWTYPPDVKLKERWATARESLKFDDKIPEAIHQESWKIIRGHSW